MNLYNLSLKALTIDVYSPLRSFEPLTLHLSSDYTTSRSTHHCYKIK